MKPRPVWVFVAWMLAIAGCGAPVAKTERQVARHLNETISIEGDYQLVSGGEAIRTDWGAVTLQRKDSGGIAPGTYVRGTGVISRGHLQGDQFFPDTADIHGMRSATDLVLRHAHVQEIPRPSTQPTGWELP